MWILFISLTQKVNGKPFLRIVSLLFLYAAITAAIASSTMKAPVTENYALLVAKT